jgi:ABC-type transport system involved in cytochrome c biogenesis permease subunit
MATSDLARPGTIVRDAVPAAQLSVGEFVRTHVLATLASLRLTVVLFAVSIFLVFVGTLAQKDHDVWFVVDHAYFRVWFAWVEFLTFERLVQIFFKSVEWNLTGGFYFPGGKLIGIALLVNLAAAHAVRFKIAAEGRRLVVGSAVIIAGLVITWLAIQSGMNDAVESELSPAFCNLIWQFLRGSLAVLTLALAYVVLFRADRMRAFEWRTLLVITLLLAGLTVWLLANPDARVDDSGLRIVWQLIKGTAAGIVLLVGCVMVFRKRAGIVLLHAGIALMMISELLTGIQAKETRMSIPEGGTISHSDDIRTTELAVIDRSHDGHDHVTVVPASLLVANVGANYPITHENLPFDVRVHRWLPNSQLRSPKANEANPATAGVGLQQIADEARQATGVGEDAERVDFPAAYIELLDKKNWGVLGTYLVTPGLTMEQTVKVEGYDDTQSTYDVALRFERVYHPYSLTLKKFERTNYTGTSTPKSYSSLVALKDAERNIDREVSIWMNNPLRYSGTTFYQSGFFPPPQVGTILQVVTNPSWMAPYVACMLVATGMLAHFGVILVRFLRRRAEEVEGVGSLEASSQTSSARRDKIGLQRATGHDSRPRASHWPTLAKWFPAIVLVFFAGYVASKARLPESKPSEMQIYEFGKLPLAYQGRIKPYDTLARNSLQILSEKQELGVWKKGNVTEKVLAIRWLLDVISGARSAGDHQAFRIVNLELLDTLGLEHRPLFWRYSLNEIERKDGELKRQITLAETTADKDRSLFQNKVLQLRDKYNFYTSLVFAFRQVPLPEKQEDLVAAVDQARFVITELRKMGAPHAVPPREATTDWMSLFEADFRMLLDHATGQPVNKATVALTELLAAYARDDATNFNKKLAEYRGLVENYETVLQSNTKQLKESGVANAEILAQPKIDFEVFYNQFSPFYYAAVLYLFAFVLGAASWIGWTGPLRRASIWLLWFTFALHTFALVARIYISGRPPITNLYSTAIFIGWAGVMMALMFEAIYRLGLGNIVASIIGFLTLLVAYNLSLDGDTFIVLQAVLDTQFWLATHVVTINLGYATTYLAGLWGAVYVLFAHVFPVLAEDARHKLLRTLYGTLCFAIFFSFVGTVLGGLWADDSWGRFWGWDPKENGALMIVLWNALVLHARWGALVKGRGLATLAIAGNIITTWSYFGVNELGVGLHAYGASEKNTSMWLLIFAASQLALIALGMIPGRWFHSVGRTRAQAKAQ